MRTVVQIVKIDETGDSCYRMRWPAEHVVSQDPSLCVINLDATAKERYEWAQNADLLVLFQCADLDLLPVIVERRKRGRRTLVEYNDNFYAPQSWSPVATEWSSARLWAIYESFMREADGVLVTGEGLRTLFASVTEKPIYIVENYLPEAPPPFDELVRGKIPHSFGWAGSLGHMADLLAVVPVIREVLEAVPESVFCVMGNEAIPEQTGLPASRIRFTPWGTMEDYYRFWSGVEVGIVPLLDTPYNRCRSDIKVIEIGSRGGVPVATQLLPYEKIASRIAVRTVCSFDEMRGAVVELLRDDAQRRLEALAIHTFTARERVADPQSVRLTLYREHLAEHGVAFSFPVSKGVHSIPGTPSPVVPSSVQLEEAINLAKLRKVKEALDLVREVRKKNPFVAETWNLEILLTRNLDSRGAQKLIEEGVTRFPKEIKFRLLQIDGAKAKGEAIRGLIQFLVSQSEGYRNAVRAEVTRFVSGLIGAGPETLDVAQEVLLLYPHDVTLRFTVAQELERRGRFKEALACFDALLRDKREATHGLSDIVGYEVGFLDAWYQALRGRVRREFW